jgi:hypothetical protein
VSPGHSFHFVTVGTSERMVQNLWSRIGARGGHRISHIVHPGFVRSSWPAIRNSGDIHFFQDDFRAPMPAADPQFLASLEREGVPTIHNMILSDRHVSKLKYGDALAYATFLGRRLVTLYRRTEPSVLIGGFDALHGSLALAVARLMGIPWYALQFTSLPIGRAAFCADLSPASTVIFEPRRASELRADAEELLKDFENRRIQSAAYIPPKLDSPAVWLRQLPSQLQALVRVLKRRRQKEFLKYTDYENYYSVSSLFREAFRLRKNLWQLHRHRLLDQPIEGRYAFFGLHMQPESSIDVQAHFFSNQLQVIELMSRSLPPTHKLLVKLHKSDAPNYSATQLARLGSIPAVELVSPYADSFELIKHADLVFTIQGTIGLEAALLGKPLVLFGDSPTKVFPSASTIGKTTELPALVRAKLTESRSSRAAIVEAYACYLAPFYPASLNDWGITPTDSQIDGYAHLFALLQRHLQGERESASALDAVAAPQPVPVHRGGSGT